METTTILHNTPVMSDNLPTRLKEILIGVLLGDSHISKTKEGAYISFEQSLRRRGYLLYLYGLFELYSKNPPTEYKRLDKRYKERVALCFRTRNLFMFKEFADIFLKEEGGGKFQKIVHSDIHNLLTPVGLAFWIMDDGQHVKKKGLTQGVTLCTDSFSYDFARS
jgi:hypothetical protein